MAIVNTITNDSEFYHWLQQSSSYQNNFSYDGAVTLQQYLEELSDDMGEDVQFDPVAWCVEFSEFDSALEAYNQHHGEDGFIKVDEDNTAENAEAQALEWLQDNTTVIEFDGGVIVQEF